MARPLRIQYPGAMYHVMNRGDQREDIFRDDEDRQRFLGTITEACCKTGWQIHAYCLMRNQLCKAIVRTYNKANFMLEAFRVNNWYLDKLSDFNKLQATHPGDNYV